MAYTFTPTLRDTPTLRNTPTLKDTPTLVDTPTLMTLLPCMDNDDNAGTHFEPQFTMESKVDSILRLLSVIDDKLDKVLSNRTNDTVKGCNAEDVKTGDGNRPNADTKSKATVVAFSEIVQDTSSNKVCVPLKSAFPKPANPPLKISVTMPKPVAKPSITTKPKVVVKTMPAAPKKSPPKSPATPMPNSINNVQGRRSTPFHTKVQSHAPVTPVTPSVLEGDSHETIDNPVL